LDPKFVFWLAEGKKLPMLYPKLMLVFLSMSRLCSSLWRWLRIYMVFRLVSKPPKPPPSEACS